MRISDVSAHTLSSPIAPPQERHFLGGFRRLLKRDVVLVVVETADGAVGYAPAGASSSAMREYFDDASHSDFAGVLEEEVAPRVLGAEVESATDLHALVAEADLPEFLESQAVAPLDIAFYDLLGKERGAPVYDLLAEGGSVATELPLYASAGMYMEPEGYAEQAKAIQERGFGGYKYRPGLGIEEDLRTLRLIREAVGPGMDVMIDAHTWWKLGEHSYTFEEVVDLVDRMAEYDPYWLEEPVEPADYDAYRRLADAVGVPLAGGESEETPTGLIALAGTGAVDYLQGDVRHHRGFTGCWEAVEFCVGRDVTFVPHQFGTQLGLVANAHLTAAAPEAELLECPVFGTDVAGMYPFPLAEEILVDALDLADGALTVPDGPGLGVEVDLDVLERYPHVEGPWTEFHYEED
ncbi:MAG: mandelate racemase/muconate lactonizing enzyme family protein [Haloarculaceae archaeon]